jgi:putative hydroxymethylpyrimidine transport system substrate-binding protein
MDRPARWLVARLLPLMLASLALTPVLALAESALEPAEVSLLTLDTEVMVPSAASAAAPSASESPTPLVEHAAPLVAVPPVIDIPSVIEALQGIQAPSDEAALSAEEDGIDVPVPSVAIAPAEPIALPPMTSLEITLDWYLNPQHAALLVAREKGLFLRRGLEVTLVSPADPNVPAKLLAAGRTDLALGRQPLLHLQVDQGRPLVRVATLIDSPLAGLVLRHTPGTTGGDPLQNGLRRAGQAAQDGQALNGLRIGYTDQDSREVLRASLLAADGDLALPELEDVSFSALDAMRDGRLDGVIVHQRHLLPRQLADEGIATQMLRLEEHGLPGHDGLILMANRDRLYGQRDALRHLIAGLEEATLWILNHRDKAWSLLVSAEPALDDPAMREAWDDTFPRLALRPAAVDQGRYQRFDQYLLDAGILEAGTPAERLAIDLGAPGR